MRLGIGLNITRQNEVFRLSNLFGASYQGFTFEPWDITTLYQDRAGTTPVTAAGQSVGYRRDKSGHGNHEVAINDAARGIYGWMPKTGRRNLLTYTEQFDNAAFGKVGSTITSNTSTAPDGALTADKIIPNSGTSGYITQLSGISTATAYTFSVYAKQSEHRYLQLNGDAVSGRIPASAYFDLQNGIVSSNTLGTAVIVSVGDGWFRCSVSATSTSTGAQPFLRTSTNGTTPATGDGTSGVYIWGAQLELGTTDTAYQRVVSNYDITEAGVPSCYYVLANGINTAYVTPTITPGTDKVQVFAGVRKNSDAAIGMVVEFSANVNTNNGTFWMAAPIGAGVANYDFASKGTIGRSKTRTGFAAPVSNVLTGIGDVSGDASNLRVNGNDAGATTTDQGTGNYLAYPAYIYARGGTTLPFNGYDFGHAVRFGPNLDAATIARVEALIARNTPEVTL